MSILPVRFSASVAALTGIAAVAFFATRSDSEHSAGIESSLASASAITPAQLPDSILFVSDWSTATGASPQAVQDGGRWTEAFCTNARGVVDVVPAAPLDFTLTQNALRARYLTEHDCLEVQATLPGSGDYYVRAYIRNDVQARPGDVVTWHPFVINVEQPYVTFWLNHGGRAGEYLWQIRCYYPSTGQNEDIQWGTPLDLRVWYRFEWHVEFTTGNEFRLWPRVYDMHGELVADAGSIRRTWIESRVTLEQWYAAGNSCRMPDMANARKIGIGTEGPAGARNTGEAWYYAAFAAGTTWPGPVR